MWPKPGAKREAPTAWWRARAVLVWIETRVRRTRSTSKRWRAHQRHGRETIALLVHCPRGLSESSKAKRRSLRWCRRRVDFCDEYVTGSRDRRLAGREGEATSGDRYWRSTTWGTRRQSSSRCANAREPGSRAATDSPRGLGQVVYLTLTRQMIPGLRVTSKLLPKVRGIWIKDFQTGSTTKSWIH